MDQDFMKEILKPAFQFQCVKPILIHRYIQIYNSKFIKLSANVLFNIKELFTMR